MQLNTQQFFSLPSPILDLTKLFTEIKHLQKDNLSQLPIETKEEKADEEIKGLKFIAKKLKILLEKNKKIQYNDASRILINNFASAEKDERNIKRRVYDAINVLVAAGVVSKEGNRMQIIGRKETFNGDKLRILKKMQILEKLKKKQQLLARLRENKHPKGKDLQSKLIVFNKPVKSVKFSKKIKKSISVNIKPGGYQETVEGYDNIISRLL